MIGISWKREQGLADPLLRRMLEEAGMDNVPQWNRGDDVRNAAHRRWMKLAEDRDGPVNPDRCEITDPADITATAGKDYEATEGTLTFQVGRRTMQCTT